jgi:hypothetical protein
MSLINIDAAALVDEAAKVLPGALDPVLAKAIDKLIADLQGVLVGRKITGTIAGIPVDITIQ